MKQEIEILYFYALKRKIKFRTMYNFFEQAIKWHADSMDEVEDATGVTQFLRKYMI